MSTWRDARAQLVQVGRWLSFTAVAWWEWFRIEGRLTALLQAGAAAGGAAMLALVGSRWLRRRLGGAVVATAEGGESHRAAVAGGAAPAAFGRRASGRAPGVAHLVACPGLARRGVRGRARPRPDRDGVARRRRSLDSFAQYGRIQPVAAGAAAVLVLAGDGAARRHGHHLRFGRARDAGAAAAGLVPAHR